MPDLSKKTTQIGKIMNNEEITTNTTKKIKQSKENMMKNYMLTNWTR